jgi:hypothetical protein
MQLYSSQVDEYTNVVDITQLAAMVRMVFSDNLIKEQILTILPLTGKMKDESTRSENKVHKLANMCLPWQQWT